jgi:nucleoid-associated protein YgaU
VIKKEIPKVETPKKIPEPKILVKKHPLEVLLLKAMKSKNTPDTSDKKIDTFNKVIIDRSITKVNAIAQDLSNIIKNAKIRVTKEKDENSTSNKKIAYTEALKDEAEVRKGEMKYVTVRSGDSLYKIAKRAYGDATYFEIIFEANSDVLKTKTDLKIGQKLRVPELKKAQ